jgi:hypothetical protein
MTHTLRTRKGIVLSTGIVMLACVAALLSAGLTGPKPIADASLGAEWQCKAGLFLTTCTRTAHAEPVLHSAHKAPVCLRRA